MKKMKVYLVWRWEQWECAEVIKIFLDENKANDFVKGLDKESGIYHQVEEKEVIE
jgi:hypothetical protein